MLARDSEDRDHFGRAPGKHDGRGHLAKDGRPVEGVGYQVLLLGEHLARAEESDELVCHGDAGLFYFITAVLKYPE